MSFKPTWRPILLAGAVLLASCASVTNPVTGQRELSVMDEQAEIAEGKKAHAQVLQEYGVVQDAGLQAYVDELGQRAVVGGVDAESLVRVVEGADGVANEDGPGDAAGVEVGPVAAGRDVAAGEFLGERRHVLVLPSRVSSPASRGY